MPIPFIGPKSHARGKAKRVVPRPPPGGIPHSDGILRMPTNFSATADDQQNQVKMTKVASPVFSSVSFFELEGTAGLEK